MGAFLKNYPESLWLYQPTVPQTIKGGQPIIQDGFICKKPIEEDPFYEWYWRLGGADDEAGPGIISSLGYRFMVKADGSEIAFAIPEGPSDEISVYASRLKDKNGNEVFTLDTGEFLETIQVSGGILSQLGNAGATTTVTVVTSVGPPEVTATLTFESGLLTNVT
jgi:hypothetical protein